MQVNLSAQSIWQFLVSVCAVAGGLAFVLGAYRKGTIELLTKNIEALKESNKQLGEQMDRMKTEMIHLQSELSDVKVKRDEIMRLNVDLQLENDRLKTEVVKLKDMNRSLIAANAPIVVRDGSGGSDVIG